MFYKSVNYIFDDDDDDEKQILTEASTSDYIYYSNILSSYQIIVNLPSIHFWKPYVQPEFVK